MKIKISNYFSKQELTFEFDPKFTHLDLRILGKLRAYFTENTKNARLS